MDNILKIADKLLKILSVFIERVFPFLAAYYAGRKAERDKKRKRDLKDVKEELKIKSDNLAKSDSDILNELLKHDSRKNP